MAKRERDTLGDRMKSQYEHRFRFLLPRRTYTILRIDGRSFHTWTRGLDRPYDQNFMLCMDAASVAVCQETNAEFAFVQSDEISLLLTDFRDPTTQAYFDNVLQKMVSVVAATATMAFNLKLMELRDSNSTENELKIAKKLPNATFDCRAFIIPDPVEVANYFIWRQQDAARNSVNLLASAYASHKQLHGKSTSQRHEIIHVAGDNWAKHPTRFKHGAVVRRCGAAELGRDIGEKPSGDWYLVGNWFIDPKTPTFTRNRQYLETLIPRQWAEEYEDKQ